MCVYISVPWRGDSTRFLIGSGSSANSKNLEVFKKVVRISGSLFDLSRHLQASPFSCVLSARNRRLVCRPLSSSSTRQVQHGKPADDSDLRDCQATVSPPTGEHRQKKRYRVPRIVAIKKFETQASSSFIVSAIRPKAFPTMCNQTI